MNKKVIKILLVISVLLAGLCFASCDAILSDGIDSHSHSYSEWDTDTATCAEGGSQKRVCKTCGHEETRKTGPLGHDMVAFADAVVGCTENGYKGYTECSRCGHSVGEKTEALGHDTSVWYGSTATCTADGIEYSDCSRCDYNTSRVAKATGHSLTNGTCSVCKQENIFVLIENGVAKFSVVSTASSGSYGRIAATEFVNLLRGLGVTVGDPVVDNQSAKKTDCEIIIGKNAVGRGDECNLSSDYLGRRGEAIKRVGNRIIIAASTGATTVSLFEQFIAAELGITEETLELKYLETTEMYNYSDITKFDINSIIINSSELSDYDLVLDISSDINDDKYESSSIKSFKDDIYAKSGYDLNVVSPESMSSANKYFVIRCTEDAGENGFRVYVDGKNFIVECSYGNIFDKLFEKFVRTEILAKSGDLSFDESYTYTDVANKVYYEEFGAIGDGNTCDFEAIFNTHMFANECGQKVCGKAGATYYISPENFVRAIPVKTDVDFLGATFIVDDVGIYAYAFRETPLFSIEREYDRKGYLSYNLEVVSGTKNLNIPRGTTELEWLAPVLEAQSLVEIICAHRDYVRHGSNQNNGAQRTDIVIVNTDGTLAADTPVAYDFEDVVAVYVYRVDDKPITIENGNFNNICCKTVKSTFHDIVVDNGNGTSTTKRTTYANKYDKYLRGFGIYRSNVTIKNLAHKMVDEPEIGTYPADCGYTSYGDTLYADYGSRHESYPYYGFLLTDRIYNLNVSDTQLTGHTTYYEDKPKTVSTAGQVPYPVPMGSYDFVLEYSANVTFKNVVQKCETGLGDSRYWGIMSSNGSRNLYFEKCEINRFDAHRGFYNAKLKDTTIGHTINVIGQGTFELDGVTKITGANFISLRSDYGATFRGDMILKNCVFENHPGYNTNRGGSYSTAYNRYAYIINSGFNTSNYGWNDTNTMGAYWLWDFGYTCYMPENITIENFTSNTKSNGKTFLFNDLPDIIFESGYVEGEDPTINTVRHPYQITKSVTYVGMTKFETCAGTAQPSSTSGLNPFTYEKLKNIEVKEVEKTESE